MNGHSFDFQQAKKFTQRLDAEEAYDFFRWMRLYLDQRHICAECGNVGSSLCKLHHRKEDVRDGSNGAEGRK